MGNADLKAYLCDENPPVCRLEARSHFLGLSPKEQSYAHFLSRASFHGSRICLRQASPHAEDIFDLLLAVFGDKVDLAALKAASGVSDTAFGQFLDYAAQFLSNLGEYKTFGDVKFVPRVSSEDFAKIVSASGSQRAIELFAKTRVAIYAEGAKESELHLGFPEDGHVSNFYDPKISKADIKDVQEALEANDVNPLNTRLFFDEAGNYKLLIASADVLPTKEITTANGKAIKLVYGDHQNEMKLAAEELRQAIPYAANETQAKMLQAYVDYFHSGDVKQFDASQIFWVQDKSPAVESNISFIETYRDPANIRAEWEGFVAVVNKERSKTFAEMVGKAPAFLKLLPWGPEFEKDVFQAPDFTALEVMSFATGGIPAGINIPNSDAIRQSHGFKNVSLSNVLSAKAPNEKTTFIDASDLPVFDKFRGPAFEVQVGCHELLGHGSGKVLMEKEPGVYNFDPANPPISPITGKPVETYYKLNQTWTSVFSSVSSTYEECRAEAVAMTLVCHPEVLAVFGHTTPEEQDDVRYVAWLQMARAGLMALEFYNPASKKHGQAHMQARFAILQVFLRAGQGFVEIEEREEADGKNLIVHLDRSKILTVGKPAVDAFLQKLHVYKMTADVTNGTAFYLDHTVVDEKFVAWRDIVISRKQPRKLFVQGNTVLNADGTVGWVDYEPSLEGLVRSWVERRV